MTWRGIDVVLLIDLDDERAASFTKLADIRDLDRAGIKRPVVDLVMLVRVAEADVFDRRFQFFNAVERQSRDRMHLVAFDIGVEHQNVKCIRRGDSRFIASVSIGIAQFPDAPYQSEPNILARPMSI